MPASVVTPSLGRNNGMIGLRKLKAMVMMNWMPTMAHRVTCQWRSGPISPCDPLEADAWSAASVIDCETGTQLSERRTFGAELTAWSRFAFPRS